MFLQNLIFIQISDLLKNDEVRMKTAYRSEAYLCTMNEGNVRFEYEIRVLQRFLKIIYIYKKIFMNLIGIIFLLFWLLVIAAPELIAYIIGIFFILIGANILLASTLFKNGKRESIQFGKYEIFRKK